MKSIKVTTLKVQQCPICSSGKKIFMFRVIKEGITSKIYKCKKCSLVYNGIRLQNKKNSTHLNKRFLDDYKKTYKKIFPYALEYMKILRNKVEGNKMLEVGCGPGIFMEAAEKIGFDPYGVEPFTASAKIAKSRNLKVQEKFLSKSKFGKMKFNLIISIEVIEHFDNPMKEFKSMAKLLENDGIIVLQTANQDSLASIVKGGKRNYYYYDHLCYFSPTTLNFALHKVGLKIVKKYAGIVPFTKHWKSCSNYKQKFHVTKIHFLRLFVLNKPILSSMTLIIKKK